MGRDEETSLKVEEEASAGQERRLRQRLVVEVAMAHDELVPYTDLARWADVKAS